MSNRFAPSSLTTAAIADNANGIVLISTGADDKCISFATFLALHDEGANYGSSKALLPVDAYTLKSDFSETFGFINAVALPAGNYYFSPWLANPYFKAVRSPRYDFTLEAGEVVYLGEYLQPGRCVFGEGVVADKWVRDQGMIAERNANIDLSEVNIRLLRYSGDAVTGENAPSASTHDVVGQNSPALSSNTGPTSALEPSSN